MDLPHGRSGRDRPLVASRYRPERRRSPRCTLVAHAPPEIIVDRGDNVAHCVGFQAVRRREPPMFALASPSVSFCSTWVRALSGVDDGWLLRVPRFFC